MCPRAIAAFTTCCACRWLAAMAFGQPRTRCANRVLSTPLKREGDV